VPTGRDQQPDMCQTCERLASLLSANSQIRCVPWSVTCRTIGDNRKEPHVVIRIRNRGMDERTGPGTAGRAESGGRSWPSL